MVIGCQITGDRPMRDQAEPREGGFYLIYVMRPLEFLPSRDESEINVLFRDLRVM
jgi:hypothetical protein